MSAPLAIDRQAQLAAAMHTAEGRYAALNPRSAAAYRAACAVMPGGNTRSLLYYPPFPLTMARGEGAYLWDLDGHRYGDFVNEMSAGIYGHSHPLIRAAIVEAMDQGMVRCSPGEVDTALAAAICARFPSIERVRFCNSGTEANLLALGTARAITGRQKILVFDGAYHGGVLGFTRGGGQTNPPFATVVATYNDGEETLALIEREAVELAAIIIEPMLGGAGCIPAERAFLQVLRDAADRHGILLIFDEVITSRLGPGGLQGEHGVLPDLTTLGKYIGGGLPSGAFGGRAALMERFDPRRPDHIAHAGTFNNNVLTMAAGLAGLTRLYTPEAAVALNATGERLRGRLNALAAQRGLPVQFTGVGSVMNLHFRSGPIRCAADAAAASQELRSLTHIELLLEGVIIARRGYLNLSLATSEADCDALVAALGAIFEHHAGLIAAEE